MQMNQHINRSFYPPGATPTGQQLWAVHHQLLQRETAADLHRADPAWGAGRVCQRGECVNGELWDLTSTAVQNLHHSTCRRSAHLCCADGLALICLSSTSLALWPDALLLRVSLSWKPSSFIPFTSSLCGFLGTEMVFRSGESKHSPLRAFRLCLFSELCVWVQR